MKLLLLLQLLAVLGALCITCSTAATLTSPSFSHDDKPLKVLQQLLMSMAEAQSLLVQEQEDGAALAKLFLHLLENKVQKQDINDEKAEMEAIKLLSQLRKFFARLGHTIGKGFKRFGQTVKDFFHNGH